MADLGAPPNESQYKSATELMKQFMVITECRLSGSSLSRWATTVVSLKHPLYPNGVEAMRDILDLSPPEDAYNVSDRIEIVLPDYRARKTGLVMEGTLVTLEVSIGDAKAGDIIAKFYSRSHNSIQVSDNLPLSSNRAHFDMNDESLMVEAQLLSSNDGSESILRRQHI